LSTFTADYTLNTIVETKNDEGGFIITGTDGAGQPVGATYLPKEGQWVLFDPGSIIDQLYVFYTDGASVLPGSCYYVISPPGSLQPSRCYPLNGTKTAATSHLATQEGRFLARDDTMRAYESSMIEPDPTGPSPAVLDAYRLLKGLVP
jgi:hypothetical protein